MWSSFLKRPMDIIVAALAIMLLSPLLGALAILIKVDSRGPALFRQGRLGKGFRPFLIYKFRTMAVGAPGPDVTALGDPRITRIGQVLRKYKLDELPQLWNVLRGDMSLIGPRPEVARYVELFPADFREILRVRPGMSGPGSVEFRHEDRLLSESATPERDYVEKILPSKMRLAKEYAIDVTLARVLTLTWRTMKALVS